MTFFLRSSWLVTALEVMWASHLPLPLLPLPVRTCGERHYSETISNAAMERKLRPRRCLCSPEWKKNGSLFPC